MEWVDFKLTFLEKDICHDHEIEILRTLAKFIFIIIIIIIVFCPSLIISPYAHFWFGWRVVCGLCGMLCVCVCCESFRLGTSE